ncbi:ABC transporter substrate-binding protein [Paenibacillus sambharensis]|uniref:ABC transporter substrate-binding protein n=1 Tax=Paenibacillus sambharensis TaxID=1803190 RepID=A0A2W1LRE1_9BACL|nr:extracellular solute-binding protein [Paenibacillus sambharensis]PZD97405.1 ABC transporter substrate-binding protein [Paenibacillus sambharensis]
MMNRLCRLIPVLVIIMLMPLACSPSPPDVEVQNGPKTREPAELTLWLWPGTGLEELIGQYDRQHDEIQINVVTAQYEHVHENLLNAFAAGYGAPDISLVEISFLETFKAFPGQFYNLADYGAEERQPLFLDWKWNQAVDGGGSMVYGLPTDTGPMVMAYRPDLFAAAGLPADRWEVSAMMTSWNDFLKAGQQIRDRTGTAMVDTINMLYRFRLAQEPEQYYDRDTGGLIVKQSEAVKGAWSLAMKANELNLSADAPTWSIRWGEGIEKGDFAVIFAAAWLLDHIKQTAPGAAGKWDVAFVPEGAGNWGGSFLTLPKQGKHPEEAYKLITWLTAPEQQLRMFNRNNNFPSTPGIYHTESIQNKRDPYFNNAPLGKIFAEAAAEVPMVYEGPRQHQITTIMENAIFKVERGEAEPAQAWQEAMDLIDRTVKTRR